MKYIQNIECGNIFDCTANGLKEVYKEAEELYDFGDDTNSCEIWEYYQIIEA